MKEDPEDFFGNIDYLLAPYSVWARASHVKDKANRSLRLVGLRISQVGEKCFGAVSTFGDRCRFEVCKHQRSNDVTGGEFGGAFLLLVENHVQERREEGVLDLVEMVKGKSCCRKCLQAKKDFVKQSIFVLLSVFALVLVK